MSLLFQLSAEGRVGGWFDSHLTDRGLRHDRQIANALAARVEPGAALFTSDLRRTWQTADAIASSTGMPPRLLAELREKSYGEGEGQPDAWFRERFVPPPAGGERMNHDEGPVGAETKATWVRRVYAGMDLVMRDPGRRGLDMRRPRNMTQPDTQRPGTEPCWEDAAPHSSRAWPTTPGGGPTRMHTHT